MATRIINLKGPARWAKVFEDNRDMRGYEDAFVDCEGAYTIEVGLDDAQLQTLKDAGSMKKGTAKGDGLTWVKFTRKHKDRFDWSSGAPKVEDASGGEWSFELDGAIGNDSEVEVTVSVYDTSRPRIKGTRLDKVTVIRLQEQEEKAPF